ncbi:alkaline phosphatase family protein [Thermodesulfobacteriota bacterium]
MKIILILLDGIGDRSYKSLTHRTPLQAAETPNLNRMAASGSNGLFHTASLGQCLPSETAHFLLFGYDAETFPGRGLLEAVGENIAFDDTDVLSLAHLVSVEWEGDVPVLRKGRKALEGDFKEMRKLYETISTYETEGVRFRICHTHRNDAILVMSGAVSPHISDSDPMIHGEPMAKVFPIVGNPEPKPAARTAKAINRYLSHCYNLLKDHDINVRRAAKASSPANFLATQRAGRRVPQEPFGKRWGLSGALIASGSIYAGLAHELGLDFFEAEDSKDPAKDLRERIQAAIDGPDHDFIHVHTKVPDEAAHTGDPATKVAAITALDRGLGILCMALETRDDLLVAVTGDHSTPSISSLIHSGEPVPITIIGPNVRRDEVNSFDEVSVGRGCLGLLRGKELMYMLLNYADRSSLMGHRLGPDKRAYVPKDYETFKR